MSKNWWPPKQIIGFVATGLFVAVLGVTVLVPIVRPPDRVRRVFWFPDTTRTTLNAELRFIPYRDDRGNEIELYLRELRLGPARMGSVPFLPREVKFSSIILSDDDRLFIDFSPNFIVREEETEFSLEDVTSTISENVLHNFPFLSEIVYTIGGQIPNVPRFGNPALTKGRGAL